MADPPLSAVERGSDPEARLPAEAQRPSLAILARLLPFLAPYRLRIAQALAALLLAASMVLLVPLAFRRIIDVGFGSSDVIAGSFLALGALAIVLALATAWRFYCVSWLGERVSADVRGAVYRSVLALDPVFFETMKPGEVLSRLTGDTTLVQTLVGTSLSMGLRNSLLACGALAMMLVTDLVLAALIIGLLAVVIVPIMIAGRRVRKLSRVSQDRVADASALAGETLGAIQTVQAFGRQGWEAGRFAQAAERAFDAAVRRTGSRAKLTALAIVLVFGAIIFVLSLGAHAVARGSMSPGLLTQFILYSAILAGAIGALAEVFGDVQRAAGATERLLELLDARPAITGPARASAPSTTPTLPASIISEPSPLTAGSPLQAASSSTAPARPNTSAPRGSGVEFQGVRFCYPSRPLAAAIDGLNFTAEPGQTIALVGPSGAGKSTVFHLLLRFYDPQSGVIRIDGHDLRSLDPDQLRSGIGIVAQDNMVFSASVLDNIRYGKLDASDEEVRAAAKAAYALDFIEALPQGWQTELGERGMRLSGGQRQRIAIARALLRDPPLLLLDEATSALDSDSERAVQAALARAVTGRTTLVIAHRPATVVGADRIIVMQAGAAVESGTHHDLLARGGLYSRLAATQFDDHQGIALP
jgi:ATP-binding cassette subfamily B protein